MAKTEGFSVVIEYPRELGIGSLVRFDGKTIRISSIKKVEPVTEKAFMVSGNGKKLIGTRWDNPELLGGEKI